MRLVILAAVICCDRLSAAPPVITKVEPPNWWAGHSINPVRLLVRGTSLHSAHVKCATSGLHTSNVRINDNGTYLFVDLTIPGSAKPGPVSLSVATPEGSAKISFH